MKKRFLLIRKINFYNFRQIWIAAGILIGVALPGVVWFVFHLFLWWLSIIGGVILAVNLLVYIVRKGQDFGKTSSYKRRLKERIPFNPDNQRAVIRASICTGEKVAGFKNISDGHFIEVMVIKTPEDLERFKKAYGITEIKKEY